MKNVNHLPPGCTEKRVSTDTHLHYRCPKLRRALNMELRRCSFHGRKYKLIKHLQRNMHQYTIPRNQDKEFPCKLLIQNKIETVDQIQFSIMRALALLTGSLNISATKAVSENMSSFIKFLLEIGIQLHKNFPDHSLNVSDVFKMENINSLRDYMLIAAKELHEKSMNLIEEKFVNLEIDSGTVNRLNVIHYIISLSEDEEIGPILYKLVPNTNFVFTDYSTWTCKIVGQILDKNIRICSIIINNLKVQTKGIEYFKQTSEDPRIKAIQIVHCFCHLTSLVFTTSLNKNSNLQKIVNNIKYIVTILRKNDSIQFIGKICPNIVETRWLYIYDILQFFIDNENDIRLILMLEEITLNYDELKQLHKLVLPLRKFVEKMEAHNSICSVGKYLNEMLNYLKREKFDLIQDIFEEIYINIIARFKSNNFDLMITSYFFSQEGRNHFRLLNRGSVTEFDTNEKFRQYTHTHRRLHFGWADAPPPSFCLNY